LPGIGRKGLEKPTLAFSVDRIESKRRFSGSGQARKNDKLFTGNVDVNIFKIVLAGAADDYICVQNRAGFNKNYSLSRYEISNVNTGCKSSLKDEGIVNLN
jgi:hypothetical protein